MILRNSTVLFFPLLIVGGVLTGAPNRAAGDGVSAQAKARALKNYSRRPLSFEENRGQADASVRFLSQGSDYSISLSPSEVALKLRQSTVRMGFAGALPASVTGSDKQAAVSSYFIGNDPAKWIGGAPNYARVGYRELYRGIDLTFYGNQGRLEYDFVVSPGADPQAIRLTFDGMDRMAVDDQGDLVIHTAAGDIRQHRPIVYQESSGNRHPVEARYVLDARNRVSFAIGAYDAAQPLIIDPALSFATYLGSKNDELDFAVSEAASQANFPGVAIDAQGNVYITGFDGDNASFVGQPTVLSGKAHVVVVKMSGAGNILYAAAFGGSFTDLPGGIAVDPSGNAYITGFTNSTDFPTRNALQNSIPGLISAFVTELNAAGTALTYSTYLGGSGFFWGRGIAVDQSGNAYVTGTASPVDSTSFPLVNALSSTPSAGFLTEFHAGGGSYEYSTYLSAGIGYGVAVDSSGNAYVTGSSGTAATPSPAQAYALKVNAGGSSIGYGPTLLGNSAQQSVGFGIALDADGNAYFAGMTSDPSFPVTGGAPQSTYGGGGLDGFAAKLNGSGGVVYATYIGGLGNNLIPERASGIGVDQQGNAYVSGTTECVGFPTPNQISGVHNGGPIVLAQGTMSGVNSSWAPTALAGPFDEVSALAFDPSSNLYAGTSGAATAGNAVYKWNGSNWSNASSGITAPSVAALAVDPNTPTNVYAAGGINLFKSTNGGGSWTELSQTTGGSYLVMGVAKTSPATIYVGSSNGLIYSTNGGSSWNSPNTPPTTGGVGALVVDPNNPATAYAGTGTGVYKTTNGGADWTQTSSGLPQLNSAYLPVNCVAMSASGTIYATTSYGLYYSTNAGGSWQQAVMGGVTSTPLLVAVDSGNDVYVAFQGSGMATATNGGTSPSDWSNLTYSGLTHNQVYALAVPPNSTGTAYAGLVAETVAFLTEISADGLSFVSSSCIGGSDNNLGQQIAVTPAGGVALVGATIASDFPTTPGAVQPSLAGNYDNFVMGFELTLPEQPVLVLQNQQTNGVSEWLLAGPGGTVIELSPIITIAGPNWHVVGTADFNNDGVPDILLQNTSTNQISVWYMGGPNGLTIMSAPIVGKPGAGWKVAGMGDFNRDGYTDLLLQNSSTYQLSIWYLGPNFSVISSPIVASPLHNWAAVAVGDFDRNGSPDIVFENQVTNQVSIWYMSGPDGTTVLSSPMITTAPSGVKITGATDLNGDGVPDLVVQNQTTNQVSAWYMGGPQGGTVESQAAIATAKPNWLLAGSGTNPESKTSAPRLFLQNQSSNAVSKWVMGGVNGSVLEEGPVIATAAANWKVVASADFNKDGIPDVLLQNTSTNQISVWYMGGLDGLAIMSSPVVGKPAGGWEVVGAGDFNRDGNVDLVLQNTSTNQLSIWYLGPNFTLLSAPVVATPAANWHVAAVADFNQDGYVDLLFQNQTTNQLSIWYLTGSQGTTLLSAPIIGASAANWKAVGASDFNDDGIPDIVFENQSTYQVSVWYLTSSATVTSAPVIRTAGPGWNILAVF